MTETSSVKVSYVEVRPFPWWTILLQGLLAIILGIVAILGKVVLIALVIAIIESSMAKMRLFRLPNLLTVAFTLALLGVLSYYIL